MDETNKTFATFSKAISGMVAKNESSYNLTRWGRNRYERVKEYTPEEIERIINSGSVEAQIALSRNYFMKGGFYQRLLLHYATLLKYTGFKSSYLLTLWYLMLEGACLLAALFREVLALIF